MFDRKEYSHQYYLKNKARIRLTQHSWCEVNRERLKEKAKKWYVEHLDYAKAYARARALKLRMDVLIRYSLDNTPQCASCGITDIDVLCVDHINGGGLRHRRAISKGYSGDMNIYWWLRKNNYPDGFQILCANCNMKKAKLVT